MLGHNQLAEEVILLIDHKVEEVFGSTISRAVNDYFATRHPIERDISWLRTRATSELEGARQLHGVLAQNHKSFPKEFIRRFGTQIGEEMAHYRILLSLIQTLEQDYGIQSAPSLDILNGTLYYASSLSQLEAFAGSMCVAEGLANMVNKIVIEKANPPIADVYRRISADEDVHIANGKNGLRISINTPNDVQDVVEFAEMWIRSEIVFWQKCYLK